MIHSLMMWMSRIDNVRMTSANPVKPEDYENMAPRVP